MILAMDNNDKNQENKYLIKKVSMLEQVCEVIKYELQQRIPKF
jgi:hypothetical protein